MKNKTNSKDDQLIMESTIQKAISQPYNSSCPHRYSIIGDYLTKETGFFLKKKIQWRVIISRCVDCGDITKDRVYLAETFVKIHGVRHD